MYTVDRKLGSHFSDRDIGPATATLDPRPATISQTLNKPKEVYMFDWRHL